MRQKATIFDPATALNRRRGGSGPKESNTTGRRKIYRASSGAPGEVCLDKGTAARSTVSCSRGAGDPSQGYKSVFIEAAPW